VSELKRLALRYGILTEYTSYLVQEPGVVAARRDAIAPMAPRDQAGAGAVMQSQAERRLASAISLERAADSLAVGERATLSRTQRVGGRVFVLRDGTWTDIAHGDSLQVVTVEPFSDAYFALLRALPELLKPATLEPAVLVAGRRVSVRIGTGGRETWAAGELARLVREFRG